MNAVYLASQAPGQEAAAAGKMKQFWTDFSNQKVYQDWFGGITTGLLVMGGLYDNSPMKTILQNEFKNTQINRDVYIGITDALKGKYQEFSKDNITQGTNLVDSLFSSFAVPGFFPPAKAFGSQWFDGGAVYELDLYTSINKCLQTSAESDIVVDVFLTSSS